MELGVYTFADVDLDPRGVGPAQRVREVVEEIALADEVGLDVFGVGEHHRDDYAASAPAMILAAAAERTSRSAVSVLSSDDPVRVVQQFATLDLLSGGRAEIMAGRGSFTRSPSSARGCSGSRWRWPSSAVTRSDSPRSSTCTAGPWTRPGTIRSR